MVIFFSFLIINIYAPNFVKTYAFCESCSLLANRFIFGAITTVGIWCANSLKTGRAIEYRISIFYGISIALVFGFIQIILFKYASHWFPFFIKDRETISHIQLFFNSFVYGIIPNILLMLLIQIYSVQNRSRSIIFLRITKLCLTPSILLFGLLWLKLDTPYAIGLWLALSNVILFVIYSRELLGSTILGAQSAKRLMRTLEKNVFKFWEILKNGVAYGGQLSLEALCSLLILIVIYRTSSQASSVYYFVRHLILLFCSLPVSISHVLVFHASKNGLEDLNETVDYSKKIIPYMLLFIIIVSIGLITFQEIIANHVDSVKSIRHLPSMRLQYIDACISIPVIIALETIRFFLMAILRGVKRVILPSTVNILSILLITFPLGLALFRYADLTILGFIISRLIGLLIIDIILFMILISISKKPIHAGPYGRLDNN